MVFVSNKTTSTIRVTVTNNSGGSASTYALYPQNLETYSANHWSRSGNETVKIKFDSGKPELSVQVGKDDHLIIYDDAYETFQSHVKSY